jgi:hypothetical protein
MLARRSSTANPRKFRFKFFPVLHFQEIKMKGCSRGAQTCNTHLEMVSEVTADTKKIPLKTGSSFQQILGLLISHKNSWCPHEELLMGALENLWFRECNREKLLLMLLVMCSCNGVNGSIIMTMNCEKCCLFMTTGLAVARAVNVYGLWRYRIQKSRLVFGGRWFNIRGGRNLFS